jgi:hypothetical protein
MQLLKHDNLETVIGLSKKNITELYENMDNPDFNGLMKLQIDTENHALDNRLVRLIVR